MHTEDSILRTGPTYTTWLYGPERNNGLLGRINNNGHSGGELEATMMRSWIKLTLIHELILQLESLPEQDYVDVASIERLKNYIKGDKKRRGTLLNLIACLNAQDGTEHVEFPKQFKRINLHKINMYHLVFDFVKESWPFLNIALASDTANVDPTSTTEVFVGHQI
ncbi:hypothetical protein EWM64_g7265 [Hericium alpestre]|uniref:Uncharacterized protein n=1 Tax=Hericium alpestre TaxID=135208 RepID=A0A4Y9ZRR8_9AGAM|nr:hypothetical protein EWM64_g7265 [Hericium alpestre]